MHLGYDGIMKHYKYDQFKNDIPPLASLCQSFQADTVVAIARGGMTLAHALCMALNVRNLQSIRCESYDGENQRSSITIIGECDFSHSKRVLIVDDIVDSGKTMHALLDISTGFLWEFAGTPIESSLGQRKAYSVKVTFDNERIEKIELL